MPVWLQVVWAIGAPLGLSVMGWVAVQTWNMRIRMAKLEAEIVAMQPKCTKHDELLSGLSAGINRIDRNIVRLSTKLNVEGIENYSDR